MTIGWHFDNTYSKLSDNFKEIIKPTKRVVKHSNHKIHYKSDDSYNL